MLVREDPFTDIQSIAVNRKRSVVHRIGDQDGNQFLGKLAWPVVIRASSNHDRKSESLEVTQCPQVCAGFACGIGTAGIQWRIFPKCALRSETPVDFVGGYL